MAKVEMLRELMTRRLTAVVEEICGLFETTIADYEENVSRLKTETERQGKLLNAVLNDGAKLHSADIQLVFKIKKEQQECESSLGQKSLYLNPNPIKQENQYVWSSQAAQCLEESETVPVPVEAKSQEEEQHSSPYFLNVTNSLHCALKEFDADTEQVLTPDEAPSVQDVEEPKDFLPPQIKEEQDTSWMVDGGWNDDIEEKAFLSKPVEVKEAEPSTSSSAQQIETYSNDCGGTKAVLQSDSEKTSNSSDCETEDSDDEWNRTPPKQSNSIVMRSNKVSDSEPDRKAVPASDSKPAADFIPGTMQKPKASDSSETEDSDDDNWKHKKKTVSPIVKPKEAPKCVSELSRQTVADSECGKRLGLKQNLRKRTRSSPDTVSKNFKDGKTVNAHKKNVEEKSFPCSMCDKKFKKKGFLALHEKMHKVQHT